MRDTTLTFPQTLVLRYAHFEPEGRKQPQVVEDYCGWFLARSRAVDTVLLSRRNSFRLPSAPTGNACSNGQRFNVPWPYSTRPRVYPPPRRPTRASDLHNRYQISSWLRTARKGCGFFLPKFSKDQIKTKISPCRISKVLP